MIFHDADARSGASQGHSLIRTSRNCFFIKRKHTKNELTVEKAAGWWCTSSSCGWESSYLCTYPVRGNPYNDDARARGVTVALIRIDEIEDRFPASG